MNRALPALLCLLGALAGCEDTGISNVGRREIVTSKELVKLQGVTGAILVEIHGLPWRGADPAEVAGTLRMPEGPGRQVRFRPVPPGQGLIGGGARLVLWFHPRGKSSSVKACHTTSELETDDPGGDGFVVEATFCKGSNWVTHARFDASDVDQNDWLAYYLRMMELMDVMFPKR